MARDVSITATTTTSVLPPGVAQGLTQFSILNDAVPPVVVYTQTVSGFTALFTGVENGVYTAEVQALDTNGNNLGTPAVTPFTVVDLLFNQPLAPLSVTVT
jgi:hypothetical protein